MRRIRQRFLQMLRMLQRKRVNFRFSETRAPRARGGAMRNLEGPGSIENSEERDVRGRSSLGSADVPPQRHDHALAGFLLRAGGGVSVRELTLRHSIKLQCCRLTSLSCRPTAERAEREIRPLESGRSRTSTGLAAANPFSGMCEVTRTRWFCERISQGNLRYPRAKAIRRRIQEL